MQMQQLNMFGYLKHTIPRNEVLHRVKSNLPMKLVAPFIVILIIILAIGMYVSFNNSHWSRSQIEDNTIVDISQINTLSSFNDALLIAQQKVDSWRKGAFLSFIILKIHGEDALKSKKGTVIYTFHTKNDSFFGLPHVLSNVEIDIYNKEITKFWVFGGEKLNEPPLQITDWTVDFQQIFDIIEKNSEDLALNKDSEIIVRAFSDELQIEVKGSSEKHFNINAITGVVSSKTNMNSN